MVVMVVVVMMVILRCFSFLSYIPVLHTLLHPIPQCMREAHIHHQRLLHAISQSACFFLFPFWMYIDVWDIISQLHKVGVGVGVGLWVWVYVLHGKITHTSTQCSSLLSSPGPALGLATVGCATQWVFELCSEHSSFHHDIGCLPCQLFCCQCS